MKPAVNGIKTFFFVADEGIKSARKFVPISLLALTTIIRPVWKGLTSLTTLA
jgi:hypothetical protein